MNQVPEIVINKMPDQKTLEAFLRGMHGEVTVIFNIEKGEFVSREPKPDPNLGKPITDFGRRLQTL